MRLEEAVRHVEGLPRPHLTPERGAELYGHVLRTQPARILELGSGRGGSALYMAAALDELQDGSILSVDSCRWPWRDPTADELLRSAGLDDYVSFVRPFATYNWFLRHMMLRSAETSDDLFDLVFVDGAKDFSTVGLSLVMATRLLKRGGWLACDDLGWSYRDYCPSGRHFGLAVDELTEDERDTPQVGAAFELFVEACGEFQSTRVTAGWMGWAQRRA